MFSNASLNIRVYFFFTRTQHSSSEMPRPHKNIKAFPEGNDVSMAGGKGNAIDKGVGKGKAHDKCIEPRKSIQAPT